MIFRASFVIRSPVQSLTVKGNVWRCLGSYSVVSLYSYSRYGLQHLEHVNEPSIRIDVYRNRKTLVGRTPK